MKRFYVVVPYFCYESKKNHAHCIKLRRVLERTRTYTKGKTHFRLLLQVDFYDATRNVIYQFLGCWWHCHQTGCKFCPTDPNKRYREKDGILKTYQLVNEEREAQETKIKEDYPGIEIINYWYCEWPPSELKSEYESFLERNKDDMPPYRMSVNKAKMPNSTDTISLHWTPDDDPLSTIHYLDLNSSFSFQMLNHRYPTGLPSRFYDFQLPNALEVDQDNKIIYPLTSKKSKEEAFGVAMVLIIPPNDVKCDKDNDYLGWLKEMSNLLVPYLQYRASNSKACAALCGNCAEAELTKSSKSIRSVKDCQCNEQKRAFIITIVFQELNFSVLKMGYRVKKFYECLLFERGEYVYQKFYSSLAKLKIRYDGNKSQMSDVEFVREINAEMQFNPPLQVDDLAKPSIESKIKASMMKV